MTAGRGRGRLGRCGAARSGADKQRAVRQQSFTLMMRRARSRPAIGWVCYFRAGTPACAPASGCGCLGCISAHRCEAVSILAPRLSAIAAAPSTMLARKISSALAATGAQAACADHDEGAVHAACRCRMAP